MGGELKLSPERFAKYLGDVLAQYDTRLDALEKGHSIGKRHHLSQMFSGEEWDKATDEATGSTYYGERISEMDRDELLFIIGRQAKALRRYGVWA